MTIRVQVGGVELELPDGAQARDLSRPSSRAPRTGRGPLPRGPIPVEPPSLSGPATVDPVVQSMTAQDMELISAFELDLSAESTLTRRVRGAPSPRKAHVSLAEHEDAVILLETEGVYEWHVKPAAVATAPPMRRGAIVERGAKTVTFDLALPGGGPAPSAPGRKRAGPLGFVADKVRGYVLKFVAGLIVGEGVKFLERKARKGFVVMEGDDPGKWRFIESLDTEELPANHAPRVLLFVHGTFSSTQGAFGALTATAWGKSFLADARKTYDLIVGYDHPTLSEDPRDNATDLLARLERSFKRTPQIDAVAHSRGALVLRSLIELRLPHSTLRTAVRHAIFVGGTNGGTQLAEPDNWNRLIDLYTNIAVAGGKAIDLLGAPGAGLIIREAVQTLGALVKYLASAAISDRRAPGISAMEPDGTFVTEINQTQPGQPGAADSMFYVITSDFDIKLGGPGAPGISKRLQQWLADVMANSVMPAANDLVVDVPSMSKIDPAAGVFVKDRWDFGRNPFVYHTIYFLQADAVRAIARWLQLRPARAVETRELFAADLGIAADTSLAVVHSEDPFDDVLAKIRTQLPQYVVVVRPNQPEPYRYAFRSAELLELGKKVKPKLSVWLALEADALLRLGEDSASGTVPLTNPAAPRANFGTRGLTAGRTIVVDGMAPRAVIEPSGVSQSIFDVKDTLSAGGRRGAMSRAVPPRDRRRVMRRAARVRGGAMSGAAPPAARDRRGGPRRSGVRASDKSDAAVRQLVRRRFMSTEPSGDAPAAVIRRNGGTAQFNLAARMSQQVAVNKTAQVDATISRDEIERIAGVEEAHGKADVKLERELIIQLFGTKNFIPVGDDRAVLDPNEKRRHDLMFQVRATNIGDGEVQLLILQGVEKLATLILRPQIVAAVSAKDAGSVHAQHDAVPARNGGAGNYPLLHIKEASHGDELSYEFFLKIGNQFFSGTSKPIKVDRAAYVAAMYKEIEERWLNNKNDVDAFEQELRTYGGTLFDELVPPELQEPLWKARDTLAAILVVSQEPFIPWEVVHLKPPQQPGNPPTSVGKQSHFLAQKGLVRWLANHPPAPAQIRIRANHSFFVIPDYPLEDWKLPEAQKEIRYLQQLRARRYTAEVNAVRKLLEDAGSVDHFHFAGHGEADLQTAQMPSPPARMMMLGAFSDGKYYPSYLDSNQVQQHASLTGPDGNRPLIVLNACQVGRSQSTLTSVGGFAYAFLGTGAGAFVGTLWMVGDEPAHTFTETFYRELVKGGTIAQATISARKAAFAAREGTWLAYVVYGLPDGRVVWDGKKPTKTASARRKERVTSHR